MLKRIVACAPKLRLSALAFVLGTQLAESALRLRLDEPFVPQHSIDLDACYGSGPERHDRKCLHSHLLPVLLAHRSYLSLALFRHSPVLSCSCNRRRRSLAIVRVHNTLDKADGKH